MTILDKASHTSLSMYARDSKGKTNERDITQHSLAPLTPSI